MTLRQQSSPAPTATSIFSPTSPVPSAVPVPLPDRTADNDSGTPNAEDDGSSAVGGDDTTPEDNSSSRDDDDFAQPRLRLKVPDLEHSGAAKFLGAVNASTLVTESIAKVQRLLYRSPSETHTTVPPTRSVTLVLREMDGVAYTTGSSLDSDHKEIHFSLSYIDSIKPAERLTDEITGVVVHELVHCYQWDAKGTCPGGLIEGIADWVRLNCDLSPPHWKRETSGDWDGGYQHTAYFLQYLEGRYGEGTVRKINEKLRLHEYEAKPFWTELLGRPVGQLWEDYVKKVADEAPADDQTSS
ncbi:peptidase of plants and bacteria-domain-containing protein [Lasiosphaeria ovina]|uniref:Peptidase of plants and bacteria-domain-containing protein n=1 Tax=Lasiosphaeria ovina TaxID=92902 RepID=A0AAE0TTI4_9PEZI|nr:peptidase of plants and bacteria-domain-containing protein [Lasiosphaeria ovina]